MAALLLLPQPGIQAAKDALCIWSRDVVPSLFPYMVFCRLLAARLRRAHMPAAPAAAVLGMLGGSPSGASVLAAYGDRLSRRDLMSLAAMTGTISPMFLLHTVGQWAADPRLGRQLFLSHVIGALAAALCICRLWSGMPRAACADAPGPSAEAGADPIAHSVLAILNVGGCIVFYSVIAGLAGQLPWLQGTAGAVMHAALEAAGGMHALAASSQPPVLRAVLLAAASGFSGLSILSQNLVFLRPFGVRMVHLISFGLLRGLIAGCAMALMLLLR